MFSLMALHYVTSFGLMTLEISLASPRAWNVCTVRHVAM